MSEYSDTPLKRAETILQAIASAANLRTYDFAPVRNVITIVTYESGAVVYHSENDDLDEIYEEMEEALCQVEEQIGKLDVDET